MAKIISVTNQKGGVGKTTTTGALLCGIAAKGNKVLGVDLDPQGSLGFSLGVDIERGSSVYEVLRGDADIIEAIKPAAVETLDILPSNILLSGADLEFNRSGREYLLKNALEPVMNKYDYIIIDTPPALNILTVNSYTVADRLIIPMAPDILSLLGISQIKETINNVQKYYNPHLKLLGILLVKYNRRTNLSREVEELAIQIAKQLDTVVLEVKIRNSIAVAESPAHAESVLTYAPRSNAAMDFARLVDYVMEELYSKRKR